MKKFLTDLKLVLTGIKHWDDSKKLALTSFSSGSIHMIYTIVFAVSSIRPLGIYNLCVSLLYYSICIYILKTSQLKQMYYFTMFEVPIHSALASLLVGWNCGFMLYNIAMLSVAFYFMMAINDFKYKLWHPMIFSASVMILFIVIRHICTHITPYYQDSISPGLAAGLYALNSIVAFSISFFFSAFFTLEMVYAQNQLIKENNILDQMAHYDPLTKLLNRRSMEVHLNQVMEHVKNTANAQFTIVMGDIDDFKQVNDTYGHDYGDKILVMIAESIQKQMRSEDQLCRWGGEEFLLLIHTGEPFAGKIVERIRGTISLAKVPIEGTDKSISVTMTFGLATYTPGSTMDQLIQTADQNLYIGKKSGKNRIIS